MFAGTFEALISVARLPASVLAAGVAIKLMDDFLDGAGDRRAGTVTVAARIGAGVLPYCLLALTVALLLEPQVTGALFLGAYAIGMAHDLDRRLPTGLKGWQESLLAAGIAVVGAGWAMATAAIASMLFVQCVDDMADAPGDHVRGQANLVNALGRVETTFVAMASLIVAAGLAPSLTTAVIVAVTVIEWLFRGTLLPDSTASAGVVTDVAVVTVDNVPVVTVGKVRVTNEYTVSSQSAGIKPMRGQQTLSAKSATEPPGELPPSEQNTGSRPRADAPDAAGGKAQ